MEIAKYKKNSGAIYAEVKAGFAQPGSYSIFLWEANVNQVVEKYEGNFINTDDDKFKMPEPIAENNGRIVDVGVTFKIIPPIKDYFAEVIITQDGNKIGSDQQQGTTNEQTKSLKLIIQLVQED
jgi:hypothetical protein